MASNTMLLQWLGRAVQWVQAQEQPGGSTALALATCAVLLLLLIVGAAHLHTCMALGTALDDGHWAPPSVVVRHIPLQPPPLAQLWLWPSNRLPNVPGELMTDRNTQALHGPPSPPPVCMRITAMPH